MRGAALLSLLCLTAGVQAVDTLVDLGHAKYQGVALQNGVNQWLNVRFAAPCNGTNRFREAQPVEQQSAVQDASKNGPLCLAKGEQEGLQYESERQYMAEDCLNLGIFAPATATATSKLPVMFFIQGGGFSSNSNGNFNGSDLVLASENNMIVVRTNYRVGILGFIGGYDVAAGLSGASPNNGVKDMLAAARFVKEHIAAFGGDPDHIVLSGVSSGAEAIDIILTSNNGAGWPDLFVGAAVESTGHYGTAQPAGREEAYLKNVNSTGCMDATDRIQCMRDIPISTFQSTITSDGWGPQVDGVISSDAHTRMFEMDRFQKIPVMYGATTNEAGATYISNVNADTDEDIRAGMKSAVASITNETLDKMMAMYPTSLNGMSFFARDVSRPADASYWEGNGSQWQRDVAWKTELKQVCTAQFITDMHAAAGNPAWQFRYNILDETPGGLAAQGLFSSHASELYAIWGNNMTDGGDPGCFKLDAADQASCASGGKIMQAYWISFVRALDPNVHRFAGSAEWGSWRLDTPNRMVFDNTNATLEVVGRGLHEVSVGGYNQRQRCLGTVLPLSKAVAYGLKEGETLPAFANGTRADPTLAVIKNNGSAKAATKYNSKKFSHW